MSGTHRLSLVVVLTFLLGGLMGFVAVFAAFVGDFAAVPVFGISALIVASVSCMVAITARGRRGRGRPGLEFAALIITYLLLPVLAALPLIQLVPTILPGQAYFEMVSALTTTGLTMFPELGQLTPVLELWRSLVAWLGGFTILSAAFGIMAPLNIGGFEVRASFAGTHGVDISSPEAIDPGGRFIRAALLVGPVYGALTLCLALILFSLGDPAFVALCHAMAVLSTSGLSPVGGLDGAASGWTGELLVLMFLLPAVTHRVYAIAPAESRVLELFDDPELNVALALALVLTLGLFLRHFSGAIDVGETTNLGEALRAFWGTLFTVVSFLTTLGFVSADWGAAQDWTGLPTSGLILLSIAMVGGGIATTAGGLKLLRFFALYKHGVRELERLVHPNSVGGYGRQARRIRREGAFIAWMFMMMFVLVNAMVVLALTLSGISYEAALVLGAAALTNTGPIVQFFEEAIGEMTALPIEARVVLELTMILGRVEVLAVIAVLNPEYWRR